jgi:hypothetical protein
VLLVLAGALALAVPVGWLVGDYLRGFGVPLGARVLIGLLMIPAFFALFLVAASVVWGLRERLRSLAELRALSGDVRVVGAGARELMERMQELERSPLVRVVGIGESVETEGVTVDFLALELRQKGGVITLRATGGPVAKDRGALLWPKLTVADDVGTEFVVVPGGAGGGEGSMQYDLRFAPSPPAAARIIELAILSFSPTEMPFGSAAEPDAAGTPAPWHVTVDLR